MRFPKFIVVGLALLSLSFAQADDAAKKEFEKLQGTWVVVEATQDGQALERINGGKFIIKDVNFTIKTVSNFELKGDLQLDPSQKPKHISYSHQEGLLRDKTWQGIYELNGDELKICYAEADSNKERPKEFKTEKDSGHLYLMLKREKK